MDQRHHLDSGQRHALEPRVERHSGTGCLLSAELGERPVGARTEAQLPAADRTVTEQEEAGGW
jgi:hypothetical protein